MTRESIVEYLDVYEKIYYFKNKQHKTMNTIHLIDSTRTHIWTFIIMNTRNVVKCSCFVFKFTTPFFTVPSDRLSSVYPVARGPHQNRDLPLETKCRGWTPNSSDHVKAGTEAGLRFCRPK